MGKSPPFPADMTDSIPATTTGPAGEDDLHFQNLLSARWAVVSFYEQGVEAFNESVFTDLGFHNKTYQRIVESRDNEAGHLCIFQGSISSTSLKSAICSYHFSWTNAMEFLASQNLIEFSSMAFATGLAQQAKLSEIVGTLVAIGETETRHEVNPLPVIHAWRSPLFAHLALDLGYHRRLGPRSFCGSCRHRVPLCELDPLRNISELHRRRKLSPPPEPALPLSSTETTLSQLQLGHFSRPPRIADHIRIQDQPLQQRNSCTGLHGWKGLLRRLLPRRQQHHRTLRYRDELVSDFGNVW